MGSTEDFFISLDVEADLLSLRVVQSFLKEAAVIAGFGEGELTRFELVAEEAFLHVLKSSFSEEVDEKRVKVEARIFPLELWVSFRDRGLPFGYREVHEGLELRIIRECCNRVFWFHHGRDGNELRLVFTRPRVELRRMGPPERRAEPEKGAPSGRITITKLTDGMGYQVSQLIYQSYGYSYPNEDLYYPEVIERLNRQGKLVSMVAVDESTGKVVGYYALERYREGMVAEAGQAVVAPSHRKRGILKMLREALEKEAIRLGLKGFYSLPVMSHPFTQSLNDKMGSRPCGVFLGFAPKLDFKRLKTVEGGERVSCMCYFKVLSPEKRRINPPEEHREMVSEIYRNLGLEVEVTAKEDENKTRINMGYKPLWGTGYMEIASGGVDVVPKVRRTFKALRVTTKANMVLAFIPVDAAWVEEVTEALQELGFFFCGVIPFFFGESDAMVFEFLNYEIDTDSLVVSNPFGRRLLHYCIKKMRKALL